MLAVVFFFLLTTLYEFQMFHDLLAQVNVVVNNICFFF